MYRYLAAAVAVSALFVCGWTGCSGRVGGVPRNLTLAAASDSTVQLTWNEPPEGTPDNYVVYFRRFGVEGYERVAELTATEYEHDPGGLTGWYRVAALFGADLHFAAETASTVPVATPELALAELDASGNSGYGWDRTTGIGRDYSMRDAGNAPRVDLFVTDFEPGYDGPYALASPTYGPSDPSGEVPGRPEDWRLNRFTADLPDERRPLPVFDPLVYVPSRDSVEPGFVCGVYTEDGHYAMVKVTATNTLTGELRLKSWFQLVPGLRLIRH